MSIKIKLHTFKILFNLFNFLANKTGGLTIFVRPKMVFGTLTIGLSLIVSNSIKAEENSTKQSKTKFSIKNSTKEQSQIVICYDIVTIKDDKIVDDLKNAYTVVEQMPQFPGGDKELTKFISNNLKYPNTDACVQGKVICRFIVNVDGIISNIEILRSLETNFDKEAIRIIKLFPKFIPGKQNGIEVPVYFVLPISFKLM